MSTTLPLHTVPKTLGETPETMKAVVIRKEREGDPMKAMVVEDVPVPEPGPNEVLVLVMAAGVNFNGVWAAAGKPVSVFKMHKEPYPHRRLRRVGHRVEGGQGGPSLEGRRRGRHPLQPVVRAVPRVQRPRSDGLLGAEDLGLRDSWGSFAQFTKVQAQQLVHKPKQLSWEDAASYGLTYFTAYRMLVGRAQVKPGDNVLVWGAAGGLGIFALQICRILGANPIAVVSSPDKYDLVQVARRHRRHQSQRLRVRVASPNETPEQTKKRMDETKRLGAELRKLTGGKDPDVIFEHVGQETFPASVFLCKRFGKIVICGATSGLQPRVRRALLVDAAEGDPRIALRQRLSGGARQRAGHSGKIKPVLDQVFDFVDTPLAHQLMKENKHKGKLGIRIQAPNP